MEKHQVRKRKAEIERQSADGGVWEYREARSADEVCIAKRERRCRNRKARLVPVPVHLQLDL
jgi:hypothetical protein